MLGDRPGVVNRLGFAGLLTAETLTTGMLELLAARKLQIQLLCTRLSGAGAEFTPQHVRRFEKGHGLPIHVPDAGLASNCFNQGLGINRCCDCHWKRGQQAVTGL